MLDRTNLKPYVIEFGAAMSLYTASIMAVVAGRPHSGYDGWAVVLELLPILPLLFAFWAIIRQYRRFDEYFQRIQAEAFALGAMLWGLILLCWGFAENAGASPLPTLYTAPGLIVCWGLCVPLMVLRYR